MKRNRYVSFLCAILLITAWFTWIKIQDASFFKECFNSISIRMKSGGIKEETFIKAVEQEKETGTGAMPAITAWKMEEEAEIKNVFLNRKENVLAVIVSGDMKTAVPMSLIRGNYVYKEDYAGCIIDSKTAYSLFGTVQAVNNMVFYQKKNYCIRGVVKTSEPLFMIQGLKETEVYPNLEFKYKDTGTAGRKASEFMMKYNLADKYTAVDGYFYGGFLHSFLVLPIWMFYSILILFFIKMLIPLQKQLKLRSYLILIGVGILTIFGYGILLYRMSGNPIYFPEKIIPTKWSDFDYWTKLWKDIKQQIVQIRYLPPNPRDLLLEKAILNLNSNFVIESLLYLMVLLAGGKFIKRMKHS